MRLALFYHSLVSDWNHGNAHFLRGIATELLSRGHEVKVYEPANNWSLCHLRDDAGDEPIRRFHEAYPALTSIAYDPATIELEQALAGVDRVIVHEWNDPALVARIGRHRARHGGYQLFFHDTHHRMVTDPESIGRYDLSQYDGVLAYGAVLQRLYESRAGVRKAWTWHEAADTRVFHPRFGEPPEGDLVWIGNWGDEERAAELNEFLIEPCRRLGLKAKVYGVRYPDHARRALAEAGIEYGGWLPNFEVPRVFARYKVTIHIPRRPYVAALPGIPTIRPFEALACGIPLICSPWTDEEKLFSPGQDFLVARDGEEMIERLRLVLGNREFATQLGRRGMATVRLKHTCVHRVNQFLSLRPKIMREGPAPFGPSRPRRIQPIPDYAKPA